MKYICSECGKKYNIDKRRFMCDCGGLLDLDNFEPSFSPRNNIPGLFRYIDALPLDSKSNIYREVSMGEGATPIIEFDRPNVYLKLDYLMPSLSFKDRGAALLVTKAKELGVEKIIQDSSGNAGTSIAAYSSRANIDCEIFLPESTSKGKIKQILAYGAKLNIVKGDREATAKAALTAAKTQDVFYASHVYNPFFYQGTKTYIYEVYENLDTMPDKIFLPLGNGTLVLGVYYGLKDLYRLGLIDELPKIIAVQSENCPPIYREFKGIKDKTGFEEETSAEGIAIKEPLRKKEILKAIKDTRGDILLAREESIIPTQELLAKKGLFVEPTAAVTTAAYLDLKPSLDPEEKILLPLCGSGLKTIK